jgi:predicted metal-dependent hydrolase
MSSARIESICFGSEKLSLLVVSGSHDNFQITVHPDLRIVVDAPAGVTSGKLIARVRQKAPWIFRQLRYFEQFLPREPGKLYISGETFRYLGRQYRLKLSLGRWNEVKLSGRFLHVTAADPKHTELVKRLVDSWYSRRATITYENRLKRFLDGNGHFGIDLPKIRVRKMRGRWGSCDRTNSILLNTELLKAPTHCIDYVIAHELCHLRYRDHGTKFQRLLSRMMPDWRDRKNRLERVMSGC